MKFTVFLIFCHLRWVIPILRLGLKRPLAENDVYVPLEEHCSRIVGKKFRTLWQQEIETHTNPSLLRLLLKEFGWSIFNSNTWYSIAETVFRIVQLYSLGGLVSYFTPNQNAITKDDAFMYAVRISGSTIVMAVLNHPFMFHNFQRSLKIRVGLCSLIYDKILKLTNSTTFDGMNGQAINLISNDVSKYDLSLSMIYVLWKGPFDVFIFGYILYLEIGISAIYGVIFLALFIPVQLWISKKSSTYYQEASKRTDRRLKFLNEILQAIQLIKMFAWEKSFSRIVNSIRKKEIKALRGLYNVRAGISTLFAISRISIFLCLISYVYLGDSLTARKVFMVSAYLMDLNLTMIYYWPLAIGEVVGTYVATKRINNFLLHGDENQLSITIENQSNTENDYKTSNSFNEPTELTKLMNSNDLKITSHALDSHKGIQFKNVFAIWSNSGSNFRLQSISLNAKMNNLYAVSGQTGSGKSSLLSVIVGELKPNKGKVNINGILSYSSQEPWLFDETIRQNIIFIEPYERKRYKEVCRACALETDFEQLPFKDLTRVGERGIFLSGGQKVRISLARAIYRKADIYLLDDPLSAVDTNVGKYIFTECIQKYLNDKCVVLITNQIQYLNEIKNVILMSSGRIIAQGLFKQLSQLDNGSALPVSGENKFTSLKNAVGCQYVQETKKLTMNLEAEKSQDETLVEDSISYKIYLDYIKNIKSKSSLIMVSLLIVLYQLSLMGIDYFLALWVNWEESLNAMAKNITRTTIPADLFLNINTSNSSTNVEIINNTREHYILAFALLTLWVVYVMSHRNFAFFRICLRASENLHNNLFEGICYATLSFFSTNPAGRILNRFAKDMRVVDIHIPITLIDTLQSILQLICTGLAVSIINTWALLPTILFGVLITGLRMIYIKTSRSLSRIQASTGSPICIHTNATIQGLSTIRAFNAQDMLVHQFSEHLNNQSGPMYLYKAVTMAFALWLDTANGLYVAFIAMSCLLLSETAQAGEIGFILTKVIFLIAATQWGIRQSAELENSMVSVERIVEYSNLEPEPDCFEKHPPDAWPQFGTISFRNLSLKYDTKPDAPYILKNLYLEIKSEEKIGIVGRTGAGKTSLTQALFRLGFIEGIIEIDHVNIATLPLQYLRKNIAILPQDPILFSGSIRNNLDPFRNKSDAELWFSLEHVQLKSVVAAFPDGLEYRISEGGSNFSVGQRQLMCLARAMLRKTKILILDEATTNVDSETDKLIQTTIRNKFSQCTVITVAHRLQTVMDSDRIMVIDAGHIVEFDSPTELLKKTNGHLKKLFSLDAAVLN